MGPRILVCVAVVAGLGGCAARPIAPTIASPIKCSTTGGTHGTPKRCDVTITKVDGSCPGAEITYDKPDLELTGSGHTFIVWKLPADYLFCPAQGDGAFLKFYDDTDQFSDPVATDDDAGVLEFTATKCKKNFRLRDDNSAQTAGTSYRYHIQFTDKRNKTTCRTDPVIRNG